MSMISLRLSDSLHAAARSLADKEEISLNQLIAMAVAEKLSALSAEEIIHERAKSGDRARFLKALEMSPDVPDPYESKNEEPSVENILAQQSPTVQQYVRRLKQEIEIDGVEPYGTATQNGDLRFRVTNGIFAEIKFMKRSDEIILRLYFDPHTEPGAAYKLFEKKTSKQAKYDRRLNAMESIPADVIQNIRISREFMLNKRS
jgi:hypothetical protein